MADRCGFTITVPNAARDRIAGDMGLNLEDAEVIQDETELYTELYDDSANFAHALIMEEWAKDGISFFGHHGEGCEYGAGDFAAHGGKCIQVEASQGQGGPLVPINRDGTIPARALAEARTYWDTLAEAKRALGITEEAKPAAESTEGYRFWCPACKATDSIDVTATVFVRLMQYQGDPDHIETDADLAHDYSHEWDHSSPARCDACGYCGKVGDFDHAAKEVA